jgi:hypothetical protein
MYKVIFISSDMAVGEEIFNSEYLAGEFEDVMLERGYTTAFIELDQA